MRRQCASIKSANATPPLSSQPAKRRAKSVLISRIALPCPHAQLGPVLGGLCFHQSPIHNCSVERYLVSPLILQARAKTSAQLNRDISHIALMSPPSALKSSTSLQCLSER